MEASPCVGVCKIGDEGFCLGCYRSAFEVRFWMKFPDPRKREIKAECKMRALIVGKEDD